MSGKPKGPMYDDLPREITDPLQSSGTQMTSDVKQTFVQTFLKKLLPPQVYQKEGSEFTYKSLCLDKKSQPRKEDRRRNKPRKTLTAREKREHKLFELSPEEIKYSLYTPLHELWQDYIRDLLNIDKITSRNIGDAEKRLLKADYHGSIVTVARSSCPSLVGLRGIVLQETKNTFRIVQEDDKLKTLPKKTCLFSINIDDYTFQIHGNNFMFRASDRACRSFKVKPVTDL